jgi:hypothetical protein
VIPDPATGARMGGAGEPERAYDPTPLHLVQPWSCPDCGAVIVFREVHNRWHERMAGEKS